MWPVAPIAGLLLAPLEFPRCLASSIRARSALRVIGAPKARFPGGHAHLVPQGARNLLLWFYLLRVAHPHCGGRRASGAASSRGANRQDGALLHSQQHSAPAASCLHRRTSAASCQAAFRLALFLPLVPCSSHCQGEAAPPPDTLHRSEPSPHTVHSLWGVLRRRQASTPTSPLSALPCPVQPRPRPPVASPLLQASLFQSLQVS